MPEKQFIRFSSTVRPAFSHTVGCAVINKQEEQWYWNYEWLWRYWWHVLVSAAVIRRAVVLT